MKMTPRAVLLLGACLAGILPLRVSAATTTLLDENFPAGERLTQNLPTTSAWYSSGAASSVTYGAGALTVATGPTARFAITYFTDGGSPATLGIGDSLTATFSFSLTGVSSYTAGYLRIGLFNSGNSRIAADALTDTAAAYSNYAGYSLFLNPNSSTVVGAVRERISGSSSLINNSTAYNPALTNTSGGGALGTLNDSTLYTGVYTISRITADAVAISLLLSDGATQIYTISAQDISASTSIFDTFAFSASGNTVTNFTLNSVDIGLTTVPEPHVTMLLLIGGVLVMKAISRRRLQS